MATDDMQLVREFAQHRSEAAFETLVNRHAGLVYSAALRQVRNRQLAEEITQVVYAIFARKAHSFNEKTILSGWLHRTTRFVAVAALRREQRRQRREQEAHMQSTIDTEADSTWEKMFPLLDEAMTRLGKTDRDALVLRYFEGRSLAEVGSALGTSDEAAKKRISRAVEKLRGIFAKRGVVLSATAIAGVIGANSVQAAPLGLVATISATAIKGSAAATSTLTLIKGALKIMAWTKAKTAVVAGAVLILATGTTTVIVTHSGKHSPPVTKQSTALTPEEFRQETIQRMNDSKQWALAFFMYASDHRDQFPKSFDDVKNARYVKGTTLSDSNLEVVSSGDIKRFRKPMTTVLLREKTSRLSPDGSHVKIYTFADGHVEALSSPDDDFEATEKERGFLTVTQN